MGTRRELYRKALSFENLPKIPMYLQLARESTLKNWRSQGLPENKDYEDVIAETLGINPVAFVRRNMLDISFALRPEFETQILEHKDGHYIIRDYMGAVTEISDEFDESYLRSPKDFVTRRWLKFPVVNREDWSEMKERYNPEDPQRFPADFMAQCAALKDRDEVMMIKFNGIFWQLREWCGFEGLCILMVEEPEFVMEMADFWKDFVSAMLNKIVPHIELDGVFITEDMAYKAHPMISPAMTREFIQPAYKEWCPIIKNSGCPLVELDSDGYIDDLIPIWIESGINCCSPIEVAAHCDIIDFRKKYGTDMAYLQGIDKRLIAKGGSDMRDHVTTIVEAMKAEGGFIPGCDHGVPNDVSWQMYLEFAEHLAKLCGWL